MTSAGCPGSIVASHAALTVAAVCQSLWQLQKYASHQCSMHLVTPQAQYQLQCSIIPRLKNMNELLTDSRAETVQCLHYCVLGLHLYASAG